MDMDEDRPAKDSKKREGRSKSVESQNGDCDEGGDARGAVATPGSFAEGFRARKGKNKLQEPSTKVGGSNSIPSSDPGTSSSTSVLDEKLALSNRSKGIEWSAKDSGVQAFSSSAGTSIVAEKLAQIDRSKETFRRTYEATADDTSRIVNGPDRAPCASEELRLLSDNNTGSPTPGGLSARSLDLADLSGSASKSLNASDNKDIGSASHSSKGLVLEAQLVDEDEIQKKAYEQAEEDIRQKMRAVAVSARDVIVVDRNAKDDRPQPYGCWSRHRILWMLILALVVVVGAVVGAVVGTRTSQPAAGDATVATLVSGLRPDGTPLDFSSISGLSGCPVANVRRSLEEAGGCDSLLFAVEDSNGHDYTRVLSIDTSRAPAVVFREAAVRDPNALLTSGLLSRNFTTNASLALAHGSGSNHTLSLDAEGIAASRRGGFWIVNEGSGTVGSVDDPFETPNFLLYVDESGTVREAVFLPDDMNATQGQFGFEGVAEDDRYVVVGFQLPWSQERYNRIGVYDTESQNWTFCYYRTDAPESPDGGWVGIAEVMALGGGSFYILERDNKDDDEARVKRIYKTTIAFDDEHLAYSLLTKEFVLDLVPIIQSKAGGLIPEKFEGMALDGLGDLWIINDDAGGDDVTVLFSVSGMA